MHSVLKDWFFTVPWRMQAVMMAALRGCDGARKDDSSKYITRGLRVAMLNNADPTNSYMVGSGIPEDKYVKAFLADLDGYPLHYVTHTMHAAEIVGYKHSDEKLRTWWKQFYLDMIKALHVNPEVESQLDVRLGYTPIEREALGLPENVPQTENFEEDWASIRVPSVPQTTTKTDPKWDAGTGTSHRKSRYG